MTATPSVKPCLKSLLTPDFQDAFWASLSPDIRPFLREWETKESWTWQYEDLPEVFDQLGQALAKIADQNIEEASEAMMSSFIQVLSAVPMSFAISALSLLDARPYANGTGDGESWAAASFSAASQIAENEHNHEAYLWARVFYERVRVMVRARLSVELFSQDMLSRSHQ